MQRTIVFSLRAESLWANLGHGLKEVSVDIDDGETVKCVEDIIVPNLSVHCRYYLMLTFGP